MTSGMRSRIPFCIGVLAVTLGCFSVASSQTTCSTVAIAPGTKIGGPGQTVKFIGITDTGDPLFEICRNATNASPQQATSTTSCPNQPAQQPTNRWGETPEEEKRRKEDERAAQWENRRMLRDPGGTAADRRSRDN
jgi:hypothetical protein